MYDKQYNKHTHTYHITSHHTKLLFADTNTESSSIVVSAFGAPGAAGASGSSFDTLDFSLPSYEQATKGTSAASSDAPPSFTPSFAELKLPEKASESTPTKTETKPEVVVAAPTVDKAAEEKAKAEKTAAEEKAKAEKKVAEEKAKADAKKVGNL